jgi:hypothetical protein
MPRTNREARTGKQRRAKQVRPDTPTLRFPIVGDVPLKRDNSVPGGWAVDRDATPPLPPGAIRADIYRQVYRASPQYAYIAENRDCVQCGLPFVFTGEEQKYWYETLQFPFHSHAIRCMSCRRQRRSERAVRMRFQMAAPLETSSDAAELIEFATALCDMIERLGAGQPDKLVSVARKAHRLQPTWADPLYWEGIGQSLANRPDRAAELLTRFVNEAASGHASRRLIDDATRRIGKVAATRPERD